jgi:hypothetical protein
VPADELVAGTFSPEITRIIKRLAAKKNIESFLSCGNFISYEPTPATLMSFAIPIDTSKKDSWTWSLEVGRLELKTPPRLRGEIMKSVVSGSQQVIWRISQYFAVEKL